MNCESTQNANPVEAFTALFPSVADAARAARVSTEMLRRMRAQGYVSTRGRAVVMADAVEGRVTAAALLGVEVAR